MWYTSTAAARQEDTPRSAATMAEVLDLLEPGLGEPQQV